MMNTAYLLLGSNLGDRKYFLLNATEQLKQHVGEIISQSLQYNTSPWGITDQGDFLNQAICIKTSLTAEKLLNTVLDIEKKLGRIRTKKWEARQIDIDILFFNSDIIQTENLIIPHPFVHLRSFALQPLAEIEEDYIHPVINKSIKELLTDCDRNIQVIPSS